MKRILLNRYVLIISVISLMITPIVDHSSRKTKSFYEENADNIVTCTATVSYIKEKHNWEVDSNDIHEYTISLSYFYNGTMYTDDYWKTVTGDSYDDIYYKEGDSVEIAFLASDPDNILSESPKDIERILESKPFSNGEVIWLTIFCLTFGYSVCVVICSVVTYGKTLRENISNLRYILISALFLIIPFFVGLIGKYFIL